MIVYVSKEELIKELKDLLPSAKFKLTNQFAVYVLLKPEDKEEKKKVRSLVETIKEKLSGKYRLFFVLHY